MATTPPLVGRTVEHKIGDIWLPVRIVEQTGGSIVAVPVGERLPDGTLRIVAAFPLTSSAWRL